MRPQYLAPLILFFLLLIVQTTIVPLISIHGIVPDLIIILLVYYTLKNNQLYGTILGFIFGLMFDLIAGTLVGTAMISKTLAGFTAGYFAGETRRESNLESFYFPLIIFLCALIDSIVSSFFSGPELSRNILLLFFEQGMLPAFYTAILSFLVVIFTPKKGFN